MRKIIFWLSIFCLFGSGCTKPFDGGEPEPDVTFVTSVSGITVKAVPSTSSTMESIAFTGFNIVWFNELTKEIRFKDNISMQAAFSNVQTLKFYVGDEYLFSAKYVNSLSSQIIQGLVLYYNIVENKYFLQNGYPPDSAELFDNNGGIGASSNSSSSGNDPGDNTQNIQSEWNKFINQLKKEGKHTG